MVGLCRLEPGSLLGILDEVTMQMQIQLRYRDFPKDAHTSFVRAAYALQTPHDLRWAVPAGRIRSSEGICRVSCSRCVFTSPDLVPDQAIGFRLENNSGQVYTFEQIFGDGAREFARGIQVLMVPMPIAELIARGAWTDVVLLARWYHGSTLLDLKKLQRSLQCLHDGWPAAEWVLRAMAGCREVSEVERQNDHVLGVRPLRRLASDLRRWAPAVLNATGDDEDRGGEKLVLESHVCWLEGIASKMEPHLHRQRAARRLQISAEQLIDAWRMSYHMRSHQYGSNMKSVVELSLNTSFPGLLDTSATQSALAAIPKKTSTYWAGFKIDLTLLFWARENNASPDKVHRYAWADSSPTRHHDWLLIHHQCIKDQCMVQCWESAQQLENLPVPVELEALSDIDAAEEDEGSEIDVQDDEEERSHTRCRLTRYLFDNLKGYALCRKPP